jgi:hypothetical protein
MWCTLTHFSFTKTMKNNNASVGIEVLTAVVVKSSIFWDIMLCSPLKLNRRFGGTCHLHLQDRRISQATNRLKAGGKQSFQLPSWLILLP